MSLTNKFRFEDKQIEEIKSKCKIEKDGRIFYIEGVSPLPYGYFFSLKYNNIPYSSYSVQFNENGIRVLPESDLSIKLREFLNNYINKDNLED